MQDNLIFLSGPQGAGKTTLLNLLLKEIPESVSPELETRTLKFNTNPEDRLILKICQRSLENYEYLETARQNPGKLFFGNRCTYDQQAFNLAYFLRGWISREQLEMCNLLSDNFYIGSLREPYAIVLNPPFDAVRKHLEKRWEQKGKKWMEDDMNYLNAACRAYEMFKGREKIFYIGREINLHAKEDIYEIKNWLSHLKEKTAKEKEIKEKPEYAQEMKGVFV